MGKTKSGPIIEDAYGQIVQIEDKLFKNRVGLVLDLNRGQKGATYYFRFLELPSLKSQYADVAADTPITVLPKAEAIKLRPPVKTAVAKVALSGCSIGSDPEVIVVDEKGVVIPAFEFLPKKGLGNPFWDGFQAEFTVPSRGCLEFFTDDVQFSLRSLLAKARKHNRNARLTWKSVVEIPDEIMARASAEHVELGCAPSMNAYPHISPIQVDDPSALPMRFAGCHVHLGLKPKVDSVERIVKSIDSFWGPISTVLLRGMEDARRRRYYGRAGEYRLPAHGIEYRVPSAAMLSHPVVWHLCFDLIRAAAYLGQAGFGYIWKVREEEALAAINDLDVDVARKILRRNEDVLKALLKRRYYENWKKAFKIIKVGARKAFPKIEDMHANWKLTNHGWEEGCDSTNCCVATSRVGSTTGITKAKIE